MQNNKLLDRVTEQINERKEEEEEEEEEEKTSESPNNNNNNDSGLKSLKEYLRGNQEGLTSENHLEAIKYCCKHPTTRALRLAEDIANDAPWKDLPNGVSQFLSDIQSVPKGLNSGSKRSTELASLYYKLVKSVVDQTRNIPAGTNASQAAFNVLCQCFESYGPYSIEIAAASFELVKIHQNSPLKDKQRLLSAIKQFLIKRDSPTWYLVPEQEKLRQIQSKLWNSLSDSWLRYDEKHSQCTRLLMDIFSKFNEYRNVALEREEEVEMEVSNLFASWQIAILAHYFRRLHSESMTDKERMEAVNRLTYANPLMLQISNSSDKTTKGSENAILKEQAEAYIRDLISINPALISRDHTAQCEKWLRNKDYQILVDITQTYQSDPSSRPSIESYLNNFLSRLEDANDQKAFLLRLCLEVCNNNNAKLLTPHLDTMERYLSDSYCATTIIQILLKLSETDPLCMEGRGDTYFEQIRRTNIQGLNIATCGILGKIGLISEEEAERVVALMSTEAQAINESEPFMHHMLYQWSVVARKYPEPFKRRQTYLETLGDRPELRTDILHLLDILDNLSLRRLREDVNSQKNVQDVEDPICQNDANIHKRSVACALL